MANPTIAGVEEDPKTVVARLAPLFDRLFRDDRMVERACKLDSARAVVVGGTNLPFFLWTACPGTANVAWYAWAAAFVLSMCVAVPLRGYTRRLFERRASAGEGRKGNGTAR